MRQLHALILATVLAGSSQVIAATNPKDMVPVGRTGLGQDAPTEPPQLKNLRLDDPLVQKKYLQDADMLRFLRATYSEACVRGMLAKAMSTIVRTDKTSGSSGQHELAEKLTQSNRIWKVSSFEMEMLLGPAYLKTANYCDCVMKEMSETDLVNPRKGLEAVDSIPSSTLKSCEQMAEDKLQQQLSKKKAAK